MGKRNDAVTVAVHGIGYPVFARLKWRRFLRGFSLGVALLAAAVGAMYLTGRGQLPTSAGLALLLAVAALLAVYRSVLRREYSRAGLAGLELRYTFDRDGWTVRQGDRQVRVLWSKTWRVRRDGLALMLYPNRRSVNLVPLSAMSEAEAARIVAWCSGKKA